MKYEQISFVEFCDSFAQVDVGNAPKLLQLLNDFIDLKTLIPPAWYLSYNKCFGRPHDYTLYSAVAALLLQKLYSIPTVKLLVVFLSVSKELRDFCGLDSVPDESFFSRFKQDYADFFEDFFHKLVDITEPICQELGQSLEDDIGFNPANVCIIDTTGIEAYVKENNPKFFNTILKKVKSLNKDKPDTDVYKIAYGKMPKSASANDNIKLQYVNGTFCYAHKAVVLCNGLGILRHLDFCDNLPDCSDFFYGNPDTVVSEDVEDPDEIKLTWDGKLLIPTMENYSNLHPNASFDALVGDSGFDACYNYDYLVKIRGIYPIITLNPRNSDDSLGKPGFDKYGNPTCPKDPDLPMKFDGHCKGKNRRLRLKWICPKSKKLPKGKYSCSCDDPCTYSCCGRMFYTYPDDNYRAHPPIPRNTELWDKYAGLRHIVEQVISRLKLPLQLGKLYTQNLKTAKADFFMAGVAHLICVLLAYNLKAFDKIRSPKSFVA